MTTWSVAFAPLVPVWLLAGLTLVALAISVALVWRGARGAWLRALAFALAREAVGSPLRLPVHERVLPA